MNQVTPKQLHDWLNDDGKDKPVLLDVREPWEFNICKIEGSINIPMQDVPARLQELDDEQALVAICHHGMRSAQVAMFLERHGFKDVTNLTGGVAAWAAQVDSSLPQY